MQSIQHTISWLVILFACVAIVPAYSAHAIAAQADLAVTLTATADPVIAGDSMQYTLTTTNNGPSQAVNVNVKLTLPAKTSFTSITPSTECSHADGVVSCDVSAMGVGTSTVYEVEVAIAPDARTSLSASAMVSSALSDPVSTNNSVTRESAVQTDVDLQVVFLSVTPNLVVAGAPLTYHLQINNAGKSVATGTQLVVALPNGRVAEFVGATPGLGCVGTTLQLTCTLGKVAPAGVTQPTWVASGTPITMTILPKASVAITDTMLSTASIGATETDTTTVNNTAFRVQSVVHQSDLGIELTAPTTSQAGGSRVSYTVTVTNNGSSDSNTTTVQGSLPSTMFGNPFFEGASCSVTNTTYSCEVGKLAASSTASFTLQATLILTEEAEATLTALVSGDGAEPANAMLTNSISSTIDVTPYVVNLPVVQTP